MLATFALRGYINSPKVIKIGITNRQDLHACEGLQLPIGKSKVYLLVCGITGLTERFSSVTGDQNDGSK
jgi:hypothetical protein